MPNSYEPIDNIYNSMFAFRVGKEMFKDNPSDKYKLGELELSKAGTVLGGVSLLGSLSSWNERNQRQNITNRIRQDSYDNDYVNVPTDRGAYFSDVRDQFNNSSFKNGGQIPDRYKEMGFTSVDTPKRTPNASKSHAVVIKDEDNYKLIRFGQQGVSGSPKKKGESEADRKRRESFKARHAENIAKGKTSAAFWANKIKWMDGGSIDDISLQGYKSDSPYVNEPYLDIASNRITMSNVDKILQAFPDNDAPTLMYPNQEYYFPNSTKVREIPLYQSGGNININPANKGVFTAKAERNGMTVQQFAHHVMSNKDNYPVGTRRQAQFAINSRRFKHQDGGEQENDIQEPQSQFEDWQVGYEGEQKVERASSIEDYLRDNPDDYEILSTYGSMFTEDPEVIVDPEIQYWEAQQEEYNNQQINNNQRISGETAAVRNNSPLNMKYSSYLSQYGAKPGLPAKEHDGTLEAQFNSIDEGINAVKALWQTQPYKTKTVRGGLQRWSDGTYDKNIYKELGDIADKPVSQLTDDEFNKVIKTQIKFEDKAMYNKLFK